MKERPILFSAPMVRAILDGRKSQTRRVIQPRHIKFFEPDMNTALERSPKLATAFCPFGQPGDRLWVRETFGTFTRDGVNYESPWYRADADSYGLLGHDGVGPVYSERVVWRPSIHMPRWASRILLEIVAVRVERLNDISEVDALAEGIRPFYSGSSTPSAYGINEEGCGFGRAGSWRFPETPSEAYRQLWEHIAGPGSWAANPWAWVVEFKRVQP